MPLNKDKNLKLYYSIGEVAKMFNVKESALRYWEKEFPQLRPKTGPRGIRQYTEKDIEQIRVIHSTIKISGHKIESARKIIYANREGAEKTSVVLSKLVETREELKALKKQLDSLV